MGYKYILSICIPTYNRAKELAILLKSIQEEASTINQQDIEICISDNNSNDSTTEVIRRFSPYLNITFFKHKANVGPDLNFMKVVELASGQYCWFIGSDDWLLAESLKSIIEILKRNATEIVIGDRINYSNHKKYDIEYWSNGPQIVSQSNFGAYLKSLSSIGGVFSYLSCIIFKTEVWRGMLNDNKALIMQFVGTNYIHAVILLLIISNGGALRYLHYPIIANRTNNDSFLGKGYANRILIDYNYVDIFSKVFPDDIELNSLIVRLLRKERTTLHLLKAKCLSDEKSWDSLQQIISLNYKHSKIIITLAPKFLLKKLLGVYGFLMGTSENDGSKE